LTAVYATFSCERCAKSLERGDDCWGWVGWADTLPRLGFPVECPCCGAEAQLGEILVPLEGFVTA
jgi:hypothetical protein